MTTQNSIYKILFGILLLLTLGGGYYLYTNFDITPKQEIVITPPTQETVITPPTQETVIASPTQETVIASPTQELVEFEKPKKFDFSPTPPINTKVKAVIELGSEGFNYFIVDIDKNKNWSKVKYKWGLSLLYEGGVDPKKILERIKTSISEIQTKYKVQDIHFIISSGALNLDITKEIVQVVESRYTIEKVTGEKEGKLAFYASVPKKFRKNSFVVDIGSNNTKIAWLNQKGKLITKTTYGAKYYKHDDTDRDVYRSIRAIASKIPKDKREHCFIIGGAPYKLAKATRENKDERFTVLFDPQDYIANANQYGLLDEKGKYKKTKVEKGLNIYQAITDATDTKQFIFDWNANFTIGYLLLRRF